MQVDTMAVAASSESFYAVLSDVGKLLARSLDPLPLYEATIRILERRLDLQWVMAGELDRSTGWFRRLALVGGTSGLGDVYSERIQFSTAPLPFWQGQPQVEADVRHAPGLELPSQTYARHEVGCAVAVPITISGEVRAALLLRSADANFFSPRMIELLQQIAASIGWGLELHGQRLLSLQSGKEEVCARRGLRLLCEMIKAVAHSQDEQVLLAEVCRVARSGGGYPAAWIGLLGSDCPHVLRLRAHGGLVGRQSSHRQSDVEYAEEAAASAMSTGQAEVRHPLSADIGEGSVAARGSRLGAVLAVPLRVDGVIVGAFAVGATEIDAFTPVAVQTISAMAIELGHGIQMRRAHVARCAAEQELQFHLQHFRAALSSRSTGVLMMSEGHRVKFANEAFCALFGLSEKPAELENRPAAAIHAQLAQAYEDPERESGRIQEILNKGEAVRGEEISIKGGRIFLRDFTPIRIDGASHGWLWHQRDITEQKIHELRIERLAFHDDVTGLPNRRRLFALLEQAHVQAAQQRSVLAVGVLDFDRFKAVNDTIGRDGGDRVLAEASARILGMLREADLLARFDDDEFALVICGLDSKEQLDAISRCILQALRAPFNQPDEPVYLSASIGWTLFPLDESDAEGLIRHANLAMYAAKEEGKDRGLLYEPAMELEQLRLQAMRDRVAQALVQSRLQLVFQPIVYIDGLPGLHGVAGMEALLRLNDTGLGLIEPVNFMHVLDDPQLARPIGRYVLGEALRQSQSWIQDGISIPVSVNISTRHLLHPAFFSDIDAVLETCPGVMDVGFGIEVTETGPSMDHARAKVVIEECRRRGIRVGLDDFGTGSASLSHIQQLDIEHIKLDQSFVRDILSDERNVAIAAGVITTARMLAKTVIAEGVETSAQGDLLASLGCHQLQGFSISRPMLAEMIPAWVASWVPPASWGRLVNERQSLLAGHSLMAESPGNPCRPRV